MTRRLKLFNEPQVILKEKSHDESVAVAKANGLVPLEAAARKKVMQGVTTIEEMHRVLTTFTQ